MTPLIIKTILYSLSIFFFLWAFGLKPKNEGGLSTIGTEQKDRDVYEITITSSPSKR